MDETDQENFNHQHNHDGINSQIIVNPNPTYKQIVDALGYTPYNTTNPSGYITSSSIPKIIASSSLLYGTTGSYSKASGTPSKLLSVTTPYSGTLRVIVNCSYEYYSGYGHYQVYKNGIAVGVLHNFTNSSLLGSDDITGCVSGDIIQIYVYSDNPIYHVYIQPFTATNSFSINGSLDWNLNTY